MGFDSSVWVFYYPEDLIWCRCSVICKPSCSWQTSGDFLPCYDNILHFAKQLDCFDVISKSRRTYSPICDPFFVGMCKRRMFTNTQSGSFFLFRSFPFSYSSGFLDSLLDHLSNSGFTFPDCRSEIPFFRLAIGSELPLLLPSATISYTFCLNRQYH